MGPAAKAFFASIANTNIGDDESNENDNNNNNNNSKNGTTTTITVNGDGSIIDDDRNLTYYDICIIVPPLNIDNEDDNKNLNDENYLRGAIRAERFANLQGIKVLVVVQLQLQSDENRHLHLQKHQIQEQQQRANNTDDDATVVNCSTLLPPQLLLMGPMIRHDTNASFHTNNTTDDSSPSSSSVILDRVDGYLQSFWPWKYYHNHKTLVDHRQLLRNRTSKTMTTTAAHSCWVHALIHNMVHDHPLIKTVVVPVETNPYYHGSSHHDNGTNKSFFYDYYWNNLIRNKTQSDCGKIYDAGQQQQQPSNNTNASNSYNNATKFQTLQQQRIANDDGEKERDNDKSRRRRRRYYYHSNDSTNSSSHEERHNILLDFNYKSLIVNRTLTWYDSETSTIDLIVCRCNENLTWVQEWQRKVPFHRIYVYNKCGRPQSSPTQQQQQQQEQQPPAYYPANVQMMDLPNTGREGAAWIHHMLRQDMELAHRLKRTFMKSKVYCMPFRSCRLTV